MISVYIVNATNFSILSIVRYYFDLFLVICLVLLVGDLVFRIIGLIRLLLRLGLGLIVGVIVIRFGVRVVWGLGLLVFWLFLIVISSVLQL